jgi:DNA/RNA endonuclease G (NUC1)
MIRSFIFYALIVIAVPGTAVRGDYLEVRRATTLRAEPDRQSAPVEQVTPGIRLQLLDEGRQTSGYYHAATAVDAQPGWVYRTMVRRYPGEAPGQPPQSVESLPAETLTAAQRQYAARHLRLGEPQAIYERVHEGYVVAQDGRLKIPLWVQYELKRSDLNGPAERGDNFHADTSIPRGFRAELADYEQSGFDRGHMAPAEDMTRSIQVMSDSFLLSNMAPQIGVGFNRQIWAQLEMAVRGWVEQRGSLTIITGPVFAPEQNRVSYAIIGKDGVAVPTHFFKIVVDARDLGNPEALAFLLPNQDLSGRRPAEFLTSIDEIEQVTGLDFLLALPASVQARVEAQAATNLW